MMVTQAIAKPRTAADVRPLKPETELSVADVVDLPR